MNFIPLFLYITKGYYIIFNFTALIFTALFIIWILYITEFPQNILRTFLMAMIIYILNIHAICLMVHIIINLYILWLLLMLSMEVSELNHHEQLYAWLEGTLSATRKHLYFWKAFFFYNIHFYRQSTEFFNQEQQFKNRLVLRLAKTV